jgi:phytoene dehydrogenase-like protein
LRFWTTYAFLFKSVTSEINTQTWGGGRELDLQRHGLKLLPRNPSSFTPTVDGRFLLMGPDASLNEAEISKFSENDAKAYPE